MGLIFKEGYRFCHKWHPEGLNEQKINYPLIHKRSNCLLTHSWWSYDFTSTMQTCLWCTLRLYKNSSCIRAFHITWRFAQTMKRWPCFLSQTPKEGRGGLLYITHIGLICAASKGRVFGFRSAIGCGFEVTMGVYERFIVSIPDE